MFKVANGGNKSNRHLRRDVLAFLEDGTAFKAPNVAVVCACMTSGRRITTVW